MCSPVLVCARRPKVTGEGWASAKDWMVWMWPLSVRVTSAAVRFFTGSPFLSTTVTGMEMGMLAAGAAAGAVADGSAGAAAGAVDWAEALIAGRVRTARAAGIEKRRQVEIFMVCLGNGWTTH